MSGNLILSDEEAKLGQEALKTLRGLGDFFSKALGTVPEDLVGLLFGDRLRVRRAENVVRMMREAKKILQDRGVEDAEPANLKVALPILSAAADETRDELQNLWARLLAAAMDPARRRQIRLGLIETVNRLEPIDVVVLYKIAAGLNSLSSLSDVLAGQLGVTADEIELSFRN